MQSRILKDKRRLDLCLDRLVEMNIKEIFKLSFEAIKERKARSGLTIIMVLVGCRLDDRSQWH